MSGINWSLLGPPANPGAAFMEGFNQSRTLRRERDTRNAMADLMRDPANENARNALYELAPEQAFRLDAMSEQRAVKETQRAEQQRLQAARQEVLGVIQTGDFEAASKRALELGDIDFAKELKDYAKPASPTAMQQNYEFLKSKDPTLADRYLKRQSEGDPLVMRNDDGTFDVIDRGSLNMGGGGSPAPIAPPPPGFQLDSDGGPTPPASGNFP